jgi:hypothetical protein
VIVPYELSKYLRLWVGAGAVGFGAVACRGDWSVMGARVGRCSRGGKESRGKTLIPVRRSNRVKTTMVQNNILKVRYCATSMS